MSPAFLLFGASNMAKRVCVFVDGENLRFTIVNLFEKFKQHEYLPQKASWGDFFDFLVSQVSSEGERVRTYWYVIRFLDFFPYKFPDADQKPDKLRAILFKDNHLKKLLEGLEGDDLTIKMKEIVESLKKRKDKMGLRFDGWTEIQNIISTQHEAIEFRRAGAIRYNLFDKSLGGEKAVDVKLAIDLLMLREIYDIAVIVSGDQDNVPAVQAVKDFGKKVVNVAFETRGGELLPGGAWRLNHVTDWSLKIPYDTFKTYLNLK
jgi:hypothetical protein